MISFEECLSSQITAQGLPPRILPLGECQSNKSVVCNICHASKISYPDELKIKERALQRFWKENRIERTLDKIIPSSPGRNYRMISKRKLFIRSGKYVLGLIDKDEARQRPFAVLKCAIEPESHSQVYQRVQEYIDSSRDSVFAKALNYVVVKGTNNFHTMIFNIGSTHPAVIKKVNAVSKAVTAAVKEIKSVYLFVDEERSNYYLPSDNSREHPARRVFGQKLISQIIRGKNFSYPPFSFSQINHFVIDEFVQIVEELLQPELSLQLYDLYCGFGMFALCLAEKVSNIIGVELSGDAIESAKMNASHLKIQNSHFIRRDINADSIEDLLKRTTDKWSVILDPPRNGTATGVIEAIASRKPERAIHIFCDINSIPQEINRWEKSGYRIGRAVPVDMFPGTDDVEVVVQLFKK